MGSRNRVEIVCVQIIASIPLFAVGCSAGDAPAATGGATDGAVRLHADSLPGSPDLDGAGAPAIDYESVLRFDYEGENGVPYGDGTAPFAASVGYPAGVPNGYSWKFGASPTRDIAATLQGRGPQLAGAAYDEIYQHRPGDERAANARVLLEPIEAYYLARHDQQWHRVERQSIGGAAFAEDFLANQAVDADIRSEADGAVSVRSGLNAAGDAGGLTGRTADDGPVGYNFHGFDQRFDVDWSDVTALVVAEVMSCIPDQGTDTSDCERLPYIANVGVDSWATRSSSFDGFKTHGGVGGGRFKPVTTRRQWFTNYVGDVDLLATNPPPRPAGL